MTQDFEQRPKQYIMLPPPPPRFVEPTKRYPMPPAPVVDSDEDAEDEEREQKPVVRRTDHDDLTNDRIPELGLTEKAIEEIFDVGERSDGTIDQMERTDTADVLEIGDLNSIFGTDAPKKKRLFRRTTKKYTPPSTSLGGFRSWE